MKRSLIVLAALATLPVYAEGNRLPRETNAAWAEECGSCHLAFPPSMLSAPDWRRMMQGLERHFGANAALEAPVRENILAFLERNAGAGAKRSAASMRITDTPGFRREHDEFSPALFRDPQVKSAANCGACHRGAERGRYDEDGVVLPRAATAGRSR